MSDLQKKIFEHCDTISDYMWRNIDLLRGDDEFDELEEYLYDWAVVLGVLAADVFESVVVLLRAGKIRGANMLSRALVDYDVRLRYYVVQSIGLRHRHKAGPTVPLPLLKKQMHAARDWENADFKLASILNLYDPNMWPKEIRDALEEKLRTGETAQNAAFSQMLEFLQQNEANIRGLIPTWREHAEERYDKMLAGWRMQSAFLHGDQVIISDVLDFKDNVKTGAWFKCSLAPVNVILFLAVDHILQVMASIGMIRSWAPGQSMLYGQTARLWESVRTPGAYSVW